MTDASGHDARGLGGALRRKAKLAKEIDVKVLTKSYLAHMLAD
jgi:hypothetical protein